MPDSFILIIFSYYLSLIVITNCPQLLKLNDFSSENSRNSLYHYFLKSCLLNPNSGPFLFKLPEHTKNFSTPCKDEEYPNPPRNFSIPQKYSYSMRKFCWCCVSFLTRSLFTDLLYKEIQVQECVVKTCLWSFYRMQKGSGSLERCEHLNSFLDTWKIIQVK